jgi:hypothetical protein
VMRLLGLPKAGGAGWIRICQTMAQSEPLLWCKRVHALEGNPLLEPGEQGGGALSRGQMEGYTRGQTLD